MNESQLCTGYCMNKQSRIHERVSERPYRWPPSCCVRTNAERPPPKRPDPSLGSTPLRITSPRCPAAPSRRRRRRRRRCRRRHLRRRRRPRRRATQDPPPPKRHRRRCRRVRARRETRREYPPEDKGTLEVVRRRELNTCFLSDYFHITCCFNVLTRGVYSHHN